MNRKFVPGHAVIVASLLSLAGCQSTAGPSGGGFGQAPRFNNNSVARNNVPTTAVGGNSTFTPASGSQSGISGGVPVGSSGFGNNGLGNSGPGLSQGSSTNSNFPPPNPYGNSVTSPGIYSSAPRFPTDGSTGLPSSGLPPSGLPSSGLPSNGFPSSGFPSTATVNPPPMSSTAPMQNAPPPMLPGTPVSSSDPFNVPPPVSPGSLGTGGR